MGYRVWFRFLGHCLQSSPWWLDGLPGLVPFMCFESQRWQRHMKGILTWTVPPQCYFLYIECYFLQTKVTFNRWKWMLLFTNLNYFLKMLLFCISDVTFYTLNVTFYEQKLLFKSESECYFSLIKSYFLGCECFWKKNFPFMAYFIFFSKQNLFFFLAGPSCKANCRPTSI